MTPEQELEQLRMLNVRLTLELITVRDDLRQMTALCEGAARAAHNWEQIAIAAKAKADALERQQS